MGLIIERKTRLPFGLAFLLRFMFWKRHVLQDFKERLLRDSIDCVSEPAIGGSHPLHGQALFGRPVIDLYEDKERTF